MKKNNALMRASGILLVLTLGTSCFVGGTFAKYVTENQGDDTARVAKWGVEITGDYDIFNTQYQKDDVDADGSITNTVTSTEKVVAPGTTKTYDGITVTGVPEVAVRVETVAEVELGDNWTDADGNYYCPLEFTIGSDTIKGLDYDNVNSFEYAIKDAIEEIGKGSASEGEYAPNTDLSQQNISTAVTWEWPFEGATGTEGSQDNGKDTALGDKAANDADNAPTITLSIKTTVTQID